MKKIVLLMLMITVLTAGSGLAFETGTKSLGGTIFFESNTAGKESPTGFNYLIAPNISYFVMKNISLDLSLQYQSGWRSGTTDTNARFGIGLGGRYFYKNIYAGATFLYSYSRTIMMDTMDLNTKHSTKALRLNAGYLIGIAKNLFLDVGIAYTKGIGKIMNTNTGENSNLNSPDGKYDNNMSIFQTSVGISLFFN